MVVSTRVRQMNAFDTASNSRRMLTTFIDRSRSAVTIRLICYNFSGGRCGKP
jgi:hypothetical protein